MTVPICPGIIRKTCRWYVCVGGSPHPFLWFGRDLSLTAKRAANTALKIEGDLQQSAEFPGICGKPEPTRDGPWAPTCALLTAGLLPTASSLSMPLLTVMLTTVSWLGLCRVENSSLCSIGAAKHLHLGNTCRARRRVMGSSLGLFYMQTDCFLPARAECYRRSCPRYPSQSFISGPTQKQGCQPY